MKLRKQVKVCQCLVFRHFPVQIQGHGQTMLPMQSFRIFNQSLQANLTLTPHVRPGLSSSSLRNCHPTVRDTDSDTKQNIYK